MQIFHSTIICLNNCLVSQVREYHKIEIFSSIIFANQNKLLKKPLVTTMKILLFLSEFSIPLILFYIIGFGLLMKRNIYQDFIDGASDGLKTVVNILPTLIGLMTGVSVLRASGFLDLVSNFFGSLLAQVGFPGDLVPLSIVKMFSSSAATGLLLDIYKNFGTDSKIGLMASLILSSTETIFYTMSVYFLAAKVTKTRYTLAGALISSLSAIIASVVLVNMLF